MTMFTNSQDAATQWPNESTSAQLRYFPVHQTRADLDLESTRLFAPDDSGRDTGEIAAVEACKVGGDGSMSSFLFQIATGMGNISQLESRKIILIASSHIQGLWSTVKSEPSRD